MRITLALFSFPYFLISPPSRWSSDSNSFKSYQFRSKYSKAKLVRAVDPGRRKAEGENSAGGSCVPQQGRQNFQHMLYGSMSPCVILQRHPGFPATSTVAWKPADPFHKASIVLQYLVASWHHSQIQIANLVMEDSESSLNLVNLISNIHHSWR